jgi:thiamine biosynthesis lipoprotein
MNSCIGKIRLIIIILGAIGLSMSCAPGRQSGSIDVEGHTLSMRGERIPRATDFVYISYMLTDPVEAVDPHDGDVLGRLNRSEPGELVPAGDVAEALRNLLDYSAQTYGAYDPTAQILWDVYDFDLGGRNVSASELEDALRWVDYRLVEAHGDSILRRNANVRFGFGPALPGAIVDWAVPLLPQTGISDVVLSVDHVCTVVGDVDEDDRVWVFLYPLDLPGSSASGTVQLPMGYIRLEPGECLAAVDDDEGLFFSRGNAIHMILNPVTGLPADEVRAAVVVTDESCLQASVFAYALMVMGVDRAMEFLGETDGVDGLVLDQDHELHVSGGLGERFWR